METPPPPAAGDPVVYNPPAGEFIGIEDILHGECEAPLGCLHRRRITDTISDIVPGQVRARVADAGDHGAGRVAAEEGRTCRR